MKSDGGARVQLLTKEQVDIFQETIWSHGRDLYRDMPWRQNTDPYWVLVSEIMLQQTQVDRVVPKFNAFLEKFPTAAELAAAPLSDVLQLWSGLGYNRRAKFLHEAAKKIQNDFSGYFPRTVEELSLLPGMGVNTAGAILSYSFNLPVVFIETNIRTVYFYHFFTNQEGVSDAMIREYVAQTVDTEHPREWYWALMDYGTYLKKKGVGANSKSKHYKKQPPLKGSVREVRGQIMKLLTTHRTEGVLLEDIQELYEGDTRFTSAYEGLLKDGLVVIKDDTVHLAQ